MKFLWQFYKKGNIGGNKLFFQIVEAKEMQMRELSKKVLWLKSLKSHCIRS
jgi:hypothetical protein